MSDQKKRYEKPEILSIGRGSELLSDEELDGAAGGIHPDYIAKPCTTGTNPSNGSCESGIDGRGICQVGMIASTGCMSGAGTPKGWCMSGSAATKNY